RAGRAPGGAPALALRARSRRRRPADGADAAAAAGRERDHARHRTEARGRRDRGARAAVRQPAVRRGVRQRSWLAPRRTAPRRRRRPVQPARAPAPAVRRRRATAAHRKPRGRRHLAPAVTPIGAIIDHPRALIADDEPHLLDYMETQLAAAWPELRVTRAANGIQALELIDELAPQVVFLDIGLPDMSGYDTAAALRAIDGMSDAILVALTGWGTEQDRERARAAGFDHHLTKPAEFDAVNRLIDAAAVRFDRR
ncbi:response regulator, partial [Halobellus sp. Atlit-31R]